MTLIAIGGQAKNIGKTTLVCNIIAAFPQVRWTAAKCSTHAHAPLSSELLVHAQRVSIWRQISAEDDSDTARFLKAGAERALFLQSEQSSVQAAFEIFRQELSSATHVIVESTQMAELLKPDLFLMLVDSAATNFKKSALEQFGRVDAFIRRAAEGELVAKVEQIAAARPVFESRKKELDLGLASLIASLLSRSA